MIPRLTTRAESFRVFYGFKRADLPEDDFLAELGGVFMPGTPLMLRDLGLAAYLPAVLPETASVEGLPDEVAIIAYASRERYARARNETITGRMYTHTHRAVFDMAASRSQYPERLGAIGDPVSAFWCVGELCDWQADGDVVVWASSSNGDPSAYRHRLTEHLVAGLPALAGAGVLECVGQIGSAWAFLWLLLDGLGHDEIPSGVLDVLRPGPAGSSELMLQRATRLTWQDDEPPAAAAARGSAWSYVFTRDARHFLS